MATIDIVTLKKEKRESIVTEIAKEKKLLEVELYEAAGKLRNELSDEILQMSLLAFLTLANIPPKSSDTKASRDKFRRVTRSMTYRTHSSTQPLVVDERISMTPKFHPGLPETPADFSVAKRKREQQKGDILRTSDVFDDTNEEKPARVTRATIRSSIINVSAVNETPSNIRKRKLIAKKESVGGTVSVEMDDGKVLDLDITASPTTILSNMGPGMVRDLGKLFKAYAAKMTAFYKKCKVSDK